MCAMLADRGERGDIHAELTQGGEGAQGRGKLTPADNGAARGIQRELEGL